MLRLLAHVGIILLLALAGFNCSPSDERANPIAGPSAKANENNPPLPPFSKGGDMSSPPLENGESQSPPLGKEGVPSTPPLEKGDTGGFSNEISKRDGKQSKADSKLRIRLKRDAKGKYSWEITGDDVRQIIDVDRRLRKKIGTGVGED
ncbi:MAG: hypothetical protein PHT49_01745 [Desulfovibrionales bacterium]|nr:hypothetical protein [Desulfovibrionales bacterium]